ncbi:hypothetical protein [Fibrisoma montanum]|nr:hypothetical protein [Fibrisoma montanum]
MIWVYIIGTIFFGAFCYVAGWAFGVNHADKNGWNKLDSDGL